MEFLNASIPPRSIPAEASFPLSPASTLPHSQSPVPSQPQPFPLRHDLTRRCRCRDAEHVAQGARGHGRAPSTGCGAHVGERTVRRPCTLHVSHSVLYIMPRVLQHAPVIRRRAHQHLPRSPSRAVMPASTARTSGESATCTCHAAMRWKTAYSCQYLVRNAGMRLRSAHCRRSIQTSWRRIRRRIRSSLLSAVQVMRRCETVAARSAHSCPRVHAGAPSSHARVSALRECAGRASVSVQSTPCGYP
jgi:hypothetical protein